MKLFDKKVERTVWLAIVLSIPGLVFVLWNYDKDFDLSDFIIAFFVVLLSIGLLYGIKWYLNKK